MASNRKMLKILLASLFAIGLCTTVFWRGHHSNIVQNGIDIQSIDTATNPSSKQPRPNNAPDFMTYCHNSLLDNSIFGNEGRLPNHQNDFKLIQVHGLFRHGDRSPLQQPDLGSDTWYECGMTDNNKKWLHLYDFPIRPNPKSAGPSLHLQQLRRFRGFNSQKCKNSQLSFKGFRQLFALGSFMQASYLNKGAFNSEPLSASDILIQSTEYTRTINSASSFSLGFIPADTIPRTNVPIHVSSGSLLAYPPPNRKLVYKKCRHFSEMYSQELHRSEYMNKEIKLLPFFENIGHLLNVNVNDEMLGEDIFDIVWGLVCHELPRPCGGSMCLNDSMIAEGVKYVNWLFPQRHLLPSSKLGIQPFLVHSIINEIDTAINADANAQQSSSESNQFKFIFNFGHDSTITSLLGSLGVQVDEWVPFASRIVIEVWQRIKDISQSTSTQQPLHPYYLRILFNGHSLMDRLSKLYQPIETELDGELILYSTWKEKMTTGPYRNVNDYHRRCNLPAME